MSNRRTTLVLCATLFWLLTACSSAATKQIASAPRVSPPITPIAVTIVHHAYLELQVIDVDRAIEQTVSRTQLYGGVLKSLSTWETAGQQAATLELAVPNETYISLRNEIVSNGILVNEQVDQEFVEMNPPPYYAILTVQFRPAGTTSILPRPGGGWNPILTFQRAFSVFITIFGFVVDILIWITVVVGPFVLLGWAGWKITRRLRKTA
jgi:hypothetical protein